MSDYSQAKIYKLQCDDGHYYYGGTAQPLDKRFEGHTYKSKAEEDRKVYNHINKIGWDRVRIELVEDYPCENKRQLLLKEDEYIRIHINDPLCLNSIVAVGEEDYHHHYYQINGEKMRASMKQNYIENREQRLASMKVYEEANIERLRQYRKDYAEKNKERIREQQKAYHLKRMSRRI
jgi:hypothetical protein